MDTVPTDTVPTDTVPTDTVPASTATVPAAPTRCPTLGAAAAGVVAVLPTDG
jgi:hypothetical protein